VSISVLSAGKTRAKADHISSARRGQRVIVIAPSITATKRRISCHDRRKQNDNLRKRSR
jgi:hypothetical protein